MPTHMNGINVKFHVMYSYAEVTKLNKTETPSALIEFRFFYENIKCQLNNHMVKEVLIYLNKCYDRPKLKYPETEYVRDKDCFRLSVKERHFMEITFKFGIKYKRKLVM